MSSTVTTEPEGNVETGALGSDVDGPELEAPGPVEEGWTIGGSAMDGDDPRDGMQNAEKDVDASQIRIKDQKERKGAVTAPEGSNIWQKIMLLHNTM